MKIKKLTAEQVSDKSLGFKDYRKAIKPAMKMLVGEHTTVETATDFLIKTNYEFGDMKGKRLGLIIPGDQAAAWKNLAKEQIKNDKKNTCIGKAYAEKNADGSYTLVLLPEKGAAKKNLMKKQLEKFALKGMPFTIKIGAGGELEDDSADNTELEDVDLPDDSNDVDSNDDDDDDEAEGAPVADSKVINEETLKTKEQMMAKLNQMEAELSKFKNTLKM